MVGCVLGSLYKLLNQVRARGISVPNIDILEIQGLLQRDFKFDF